jgi:hypothetical protein
MDELKSFPYLDMVVRESLRLYAPVSVSRRVAIKDTVLPMRDGSSIRFVLPRYPNTRSYMTLPHLLRTELSKETELRSQFMR